MKINIICIILSVLFLFGCAKPAFHFVLKNIGTGTLTDPVIEFKDFRSIGSNEVKPGSSYGNLYVSNYYSLPENAIVSWKTPDGEKHSVKVEVKKHAPVKYKNLNVYFLIDDECRVNVKFSEDYSATVR